MSTLDEIRVRPAQRKDCPALVELKKEMAIHQKMTDKKMLSYQELERDGFDTSPPCFHCIVAEIKSEDSIEDSEPKNKYKVVGFALYFYAYAAWEGKALHLEDFCTTNVLRGKGIGSKILKELAKIAVQENCARIQLEVLNWNETALKFYNKHKGIDLTASEGWHNFRFDKEAIRKLAIS